VRTFSTVCYGDCRNSTGDLGTDKLFTGQRLDDTGLYYYGARYYDAGIGRFISADTIVQNPANPQFFNRSELDNTLVPSYNKRNSPAKT
jgi:RHS repeat-associated protein